MHRACVRFTVYVCIQLCEVAFVKGVLPVHQVQAVRNGIAGTNTVSFVFGEALYVGVAVNVTTRTGKVIYVTR